jgi:hypothetical protein
MCNTASRHFANQREEISALACWDPTRSGVRLWRLSGPLAVVARHVKTQLRSTIGALVSAQMIYDRHWRAGRVIAGLVIARWPGGRKVRTPSWFQQERATRLVTPGGRIGDDAVTESATENIPPAKCSPVISRRKTCGASSYRTLRRQG